MQIEVDSPPLTRVRFAVDFELEPFRSVYFGRYWTAIQSRFPIADLESAPAYTAVDEKRRAKLSLEDFRVPLVRRVSYESANRSRQISLQSTRFEYSWHRQPTEKQYPRYATLYRQFIEEWHSFVKWIAAESGVPVSPASQLLAYRNEFDAASGWSTPDDTSSLLRLPRILDNYSVKHLHVFYEYSVTGIGSLRITSEGSSEGSAVEDVDKSQYLDLRLRSDELTEFSGAWYDQAHDVLNEAFHQCLTKASIERLKVTRHG